MPAVRSRNDWAIRERQFQCDQCGFHYGISRARKQVSQTPAGGWSGHVVCSDCWDPYKETNLIGTTSPREQYDYEDVRNLSETAVTAVTVPTLTSISPSATTAAAFLAAPTITLVGTGFTTRSRVQFRFLEDAFMVTTYVSATSLTAVVYAGLIVAGSHSVRVWNIGPPYASTGVVSPNGLGNNYTSSLTMVLS